MNTAIIIFIVATALGTAIAIFIYCWKRHSPQDFQHPSLVRRLSQAVTQRISSRSPSHQYSSRSPSEDPEELERRPSIFRRFSDAVAARFHRHHHNHHGSGGELLDKNTVQIVIDPSRLSALNDPPPTYLDVRRGGSNEYPRVEFAEKTAEPQSPTRPPAYLEVISGNSPGEQPPSHDQINTTGQPANEQPLNEQPASEQLADGRVNNQ